MSAGGAGWRTGTIHNDDSLPNARLARFGRTVATHVTDAVGDRFRTPATSGAGRSYRLGLRLTLHRPGIKPLAQLAKGHIDKQGFDVIL